MTAPTTSIAVALIDSQIQLWTPALGGAKTTDAYPGDTALKPEMMWLEDFEREVTNPVATAGRKQRNEVITYSWVIRVAGRKTTTQTHVRLDELVSAAADIFAEDPSLSSTPGVFSSEFTGGKQTVQDSPEGPIGFASVSTVIETRLH